MLFGHDDRIRALRSLADRGALSHAYLFYGDRGIGKATVASELAAYIERGDGITPDPLLDLEIVRPDAKGTIGVERARAVRRFLMQTPFRSPRRVVIVDDAEALTGEAQSALLKVVEEPPSHALLFFIAHEPSALFPPLLSRLQKIYFRRFSRATVAEILRDHFHVPPAKATAAAETSFGSLGRALALLGLAPKAPVDPDAPEDKSAALQADIENQILLLRRHGLSRNRKLIAWLLERSAMLARYQLNVGLQAKAVAYHIEQLGN